jgi:hypothetical protein
MGQRGFEYRGSKAARKICAAMRRSGSSSEKQETFANSFHKNKPHWCRRNVIYEVL